MRGLADQVIAEYRRAGRARQQRRDRDHAAGDGRRIESEDGYELRFAVNYLAGYLLTRLLLPLLIKSAPARIVNVSSAGQAPIDFDDVMLERDYDAIQAYRQSKLAQVILLRPGRGARPGLITANCLHPGTYMPTKMVHAAGITPVTALEDGIDATARLILGPELDGVTGRYFNGLRRAEPHPQARDPGARCHLRVLSDQLAGCRSCRARSALRHGRTTRCTGNREPRCSNR